MKKKKQQQDEVVVVANEPPEPPVAEPEPAVEPVPLVLTPGAIRPYGEDNYASMRSLMQRAAHACADLLPPSPIVNSRLIEYVVLAIDETGDAFDWWRYGTAKQARDFANSLIAGTAGEYNDGRLPEAIVIEELRWKKGATLPRRRIVRCTGHKQSLKNGGWID